jgi:hypothetical protein
MMNVLVIVNDQLYGSQRPYNSLRLAGSLAERDEVELRVFLPGDAIACTVAGQQLPDGHYHLDRMHKPLVRRAARLLRHLPGRRRTQARPTRRRGTALDARRADRLDALGRQDPRVLNRPITAEQPGVDVQRDGRQPHDCRSADNEGGRARDLSYRTTTASSGPRTAALLLSQALREL